MSNSLNQEENITPSVFSLGTLQSRSHRYANQKVARRKVQVRGELAEIVSISPTGFVRFKCGTRLAGSSEIVVNYSQRDLHGKWEYKSTSIKPTFFFFFFFNFTPATRASFNNLPIRFTLGLISLRCIWDAIDECITSLWGCDTQWNLHQGHFNAGTLWHVSDILRISPWRVMRCDRGGGGGLGEVKDIIRNVEVGWWEIESCNHTTWTDGNVKRICTIRSSFNLFLRTCSLLDYSSLDFA